MKTLLSLLAVLALAVPALADLGPQYREFRPPQNLDNAMFNPLDPIRRAYDPNASDLPEVNPFEPPVEPPPPGNSDLPEVFGDPGRRDRPSLPGSDMPEVFPGMDPGPNNGGAPSRPEPAPNYNDPQALDESPNMNPVGRGPMVEPPRPNDRNPRPRNGRFQGPNDRPRPEQPSVELPVPVPGYDEPQQFDESRRIYRVEDPPLGISGDLVGGQIPIILPPVFRDRIDIQFGPGYGRMSGSVKVYGVGGRLVLEERFSSAEGVSLRGSRISTLAAGSYAVVVDCGPGFYLQGKSVKLN